MLIFTMLLSTWIRDRSERGTPESAARRLFSTGQKYRELEKRFQAAFILEALVANGGNQVLAAEAIGISRNQIFRILRPLGIKTSDLRDLARAIQEENHGGN